MTSLRQLWVTVRAAADTGATSSAAGWGDVEKELFAYSSPASVRQIGKFVGKSKQDVITSRAPPVSHDVDKLTSIKTPEQQAQQRAQQAQQATVDDTFDDTDDESDSDM